MYLFFNTNVIVNRFSIWLCCSQSFTGILIEDFWYSKVFCVTGIVSPYGCVGFASCFGFPESESFSDYMVFVGLKIDFIREVLVIIFCCSRRVCLWEKRENLMNKVKYLSEPTSFSLFYHFVLVMT